MTLFIEKMDNIDSFNLIARKKGVKSWIKMIESYKILQNLKSYI
jgi:hypothetical protein